MPIRKIELNSKVVQLMKPVTKANYNEKTVLTNSSWEYVELWLKRINTEKSKRALFYWGQAKSFFDASEVLPIESKPLTSYYCCLNAAKALLSISSSDEIDFDKLSHGITSDRRQWTTKNIKNANVIFLGSGVLFELSKLFEEEAMKKTYCIYDLLYNIPCIHRTFSITYNCAELFIPIRDICFVVDSKMKKGWAQCRVDERYANGNSLRYMPSQFERVKNQEDSGYFIRKKSRFDWDRNSNINLRLETLSKYHKKVRKDLHYILGDMRLWYIKKDIPNNNKILKRNSITLIFAVMHWLSELVRYNPEKFNQIMLTNQNWLMHEFIDNALYQYIDEISCEMTGVDIMTTGRSKR